MFTEPNKTVSPFVNNLNKNAYTIISLILGLYIFLLGRYPGTYFLNLCQALFPILFIIRYVEFSALNWELMLVDFCYF